MAWDCRARWGEGQVDCCKGAAARKALGACVGGEKTIAETALEAAHAIASRQYTSACGGEREVRCSDVGGLLERAEYFGEGGTSHAWAGC